MDRKYGEILGISISSTSRGKVLAFVRSRLTNKSKFFIVTPNPEIVLASQKDKKLAKIINSASLSIADGVGLSQASRFLTLAAPKNSLLRIPFCFFQGLWVGLATFLDKEWLFREVRPIKGREMFLDLIRLANKKGWRVFLMGGEHGEGEVTARKLQRSYKRVSFAWREGPIFDREGKPISAEGLREEKEVVKAINEFRPDLLFVAMESPKQEKWIARWIDRLNIGGAMVVGGTFRYFAGHAPLPPKWMEGFGLEWAWRLITEPRRARRILNAWPIFPLRVFLYKITIDTPEAL
ncbi:hypothetical protein A2112_00040 [Candidatus Woesebacteria bacterium GWA1_42_12]|uniref:Glycosyl transferase, WecB/TagA/CpsF family n=1 Tax=Candidatus Woesebacteria bacterium GWA1_42_12 TaxID=1802472 RepID=A0A1F7WN38_9BACT|nr:MAG: hypothetical protein A2112_00040 [Candidatus Woesebacteria bacterium GWA1_42_12]